MRVEVIDERFKALTLGMASVERLWTGGMWLEGPLYMRDHGILIWSDIPNDRILSMDEEGHVGIYRKPSSFANGNTRDHAGRILSCEHGNRRLTRRELDGTVTVLSDSFEGKALNSPNDVVVHSNGSIWFSDPSYGILSDYEGGRRDQLQPGCFVYRVDKETGETAAVVTDLGKPNGLAFSPDEALLYVSDSEATHDPNGAHSIWQFDVVGGRQLANKKHVVEVHPGVPDGFKVDEYGNIWTSAADGVHCYTPEGLILGKILLPEVASNLTFGGLSGNRLIITASSSVYSVHTNVRGANLR